MAAAARRIALLILILALALVAAYLLRRALRQAQPEPAFPYGEMRVGVDASYPPFATAAADVIFGLDIDLAQALGQRLGVPVRFVNMGYDGLYDSLKADQVDVVISALLPDYNRANDIRFTIPYYNAGLTLVSDAARPLNSMDELGGLSLAYEFGSEADQLARVWLRRIAPFHTRPYELPQIALDALRLGQADAALVDSTSARLYQRDHPAWLGHQVQITDAGYVAAVRADRETTWQAINYTLALLLDDGTITELIDRWL